MDFRDAYRGGLVEDMANVDDLEHPSPEIIDDPLVRQGLELGGRIGEDAPDDEDVEPEIPD